MSTPVNGTLTLQGKQTGVPAGQVQVGPYSIPFSAFSDWNAYGVNLTNQAVSIPASAFAGLLIVPNATPNATVKFGWASGQTGFISPVYPSFICFDPNNQETTIYLTTSNTSGLTVSVGFF